ncbi:hypothetical protein N7461_000018 [Penicillium sp. DV-2018c]|nr:hypothetical protein N7461_000018 [Penicillium sp. DV-2018c]
MPAAIPPITGMLRRGLVLDLSTAFVRYRDLLRATVRDTKNEGNDLNGYHLAQLALIMFFLHQVSVLPSVTSGGTATTFPVFVSAIPTTPASRPSVLPSGVESVNIDYLLSIVSFPPVRRQFFFFVKSLYGSAR